MFQSVRHQMFWEKQQSELREYLAHLVGYVSQHTCGVAIVFSAGIGENSVTVRNGVCDRLALLDVEVNQSANQANDIRISAPGSGVTVLVLQTDEEAVIARSVCKMIGLAAVEQQLAP